MTLQDVRRDMLRTIDALRGAGLAIMSNGVAEHSFGRGVRTITFDAGEFVFANQVFGTIEEYRQILQARQFTFVLFDGGLFQMSYTFRKQHLIKHRLAYYPRPFEINFNIEVDLGLSELVQEHVDTTPVPQILLRPPFRFDFDEEHAELGHSASHLHIARGRCRIPVHAPLSIAQFLSFIFGHYYFDMLDNLTFINELGNHRLNRCIQNEECADLHLNAIRT